MRRLAYISTAKFGLALADVEDIVTISEVNNSASDITGILVYNGLNFFQCIEGDPVAVEKLYERICADDRHFGIKLLIDQEANKRLYGEWGLRLVRIGWHSMPGEDAKFDPLQDVSADANLAKMLLQFASLGAFIPAPVSS